MEAVNNAVFDNHKTNKSVNGDAMALEVEKPDLVYIDPPYYSPLSDNEYVRRYHFIEGLARDWKGVEIQEHTKTKKFKSYPTPFQLRTERMMPLISCSASSLTVSSLFHIPPTACLHKRIW